MTYSKITRVTLTASGDRVVRISTRLDSRLSIDLIAWSNIGVLSILSILSTHDFVQGFLNCIKIRYAQTLLSIKDRREGCGTS